MKNIKIAMVALALGLFVVSCGETETHEETTTETMDAGTVDMAPADATMYADTTTMADTTMVHTEEGM